MPSRSRALLPALAELLATPALLVSPLALAELLAAPALLLSPLALAACSFDPSGVEVADAFVDPGDDGGGIPRTWRDDTLEDFAAEGSRLDAAILEPWGAIGPAAYLTGALLARASDSKLFTDPAEATWAALEGSAGDGWSVTEVAPAQWGYGNPRGLALTLGDDWTMWLSGEIELGAGTHAFSLRADDHGFLDLAAPGSASYARVATASVTTTTADFVATAGWHPIHVGFVEEYFEAALELRVQAPGDAAPRPLSPHQLRVRADALTGLHWSTFDAPGLTRPIAPYLFRGAAFDFAPSSGDLTALGYGDADRLTMRWAGQFRVDVAGDYTFLLDTDDGQRLWIDGALLLDALDDSPHATATVPVTLDVGWHDLVVDLGEHTGGQRIDLTVATGPELAGAPIPADRLRPVVPRKERAIGATGPTGAIADLATATFEVELDAPPDASSIAAELAVQIDHSAWSDLEIALIAPDGTEYVALAQGASDLVNRQFVRWTVNVPYEPVPGTWTVRIADEVGNDAGMLEELSLTVRYLGGAAPIAPLAVYESPVEDLGGVVGFDAVTWTGRVPDGAAVGVRLRTCDTPAACADEPWSAAVTTSGDRPGVAGRRHAQYRVELASDGDVTPYLDAIEITYRGAD